MEVNLDMQGITSRAFTVFKIAHMYFVSFRMRMSSRFCYALTSLSFCLAGTDREAVTLPRFCSKLNCGKAFTTSADELFLGAGDWMKNYDDIIPPMLEDGLRVMIYAGVQDLICNWWVPKTYHIAFSE